MRLLLLIRCGLVSILFWMAMAGILIWVCFWTSVGHITGLDRD